MSRASWDLIKHSKRFYVSTYRNVGTALLISGIFNVCIGVAIYSVYFSRPMNDFYATNGTTAPELLTPLDEPNYTSVALLAPDDDSDNQIKVIPQ